MVNIVNMRTTWAAAALLASCASTETQPLPPQIQFALEVAEGVGDAVLRDKGMAELRRALPDLVPFIDVSPGEGIAPDGILTLYEVKAFILSAIENPQKVALLTTTLILLRDRRQMEG